jgi:dipeptidyl aminopeptidase/acylaminoacyl peptidase
MKRTYATFAACFAWSITQCLLLAGVVANGAATQAAEEPWEKLPNGIVGRVADFVGADGVKIAGYVRRPDAPGPLPLVVVLHGGGPTARPVKADNEQDRPRLMAAEALRASQALGRASHPPIPEFLAQGWAVYSIDFRPNSRYPIDPVEFDDTVVAIRQAKAFSFVDPKRVAMLGGSHGGHVTGRMAARAGLCCAVLCAPAGLDLIMLSHLGEKGTPLGGNQGLIRQMEQREGVTMAEIEKNPDAYHYSSLLTEVPQVQCPIPMISGRNDPNAPLAAMDAYVDKLRAAGKKAETYHPDNGPHGFYFAVPQAIPETAEATRQAVAFIKKHFQHITP